MGKGCLSFIFLAADPIKKTFCSFSTVGVALGALTIWHAVLISRGETSIERHINSKETQRLAKRGRVRMLHFKNIEVITGVVI